MPAARNEIATRQLGEPLQSTKDPLGAGGSITLPVRLVAGHDTVTFLGVSDTPFQVQVEESCRPEGPFGVSGIFNSVLAGAFQRLCDRILPCGAYMRTTVINLGGPQGFLSFCALGIPNP